MVGKVELYDAFGELLYAVAKADGVIDEQETSKLTEVLEGHPWSSEIEWSFKYEQRKGADVETAYNKALSVCKSYGASHEYVFLLEVVEAVAAASDGVCSDEQAVIAGFEKDLRAKFLKDLSSNKLIINA